MAESANVRLLALEMLLELERGAYSHQVLRDVLGKYGYLDRRDRAFLTRLFEGTIQRMIELDYVIDCFAKVKTTRQKPVVRNILRLGAYQIKYMDAVPDAAAVSESVKLARQKGFSNLGGFVNGVLRSVARNADSIRYPGEEDGLAYAFSLRYSMPEWIVEMWLGAYGEERTRDLLEAFLVPAPITVRVNLARTTVKELTERLADEGIAAKSVRVSYGLPDYALALPNAGAIYDLPSFREGLFYVQDPSSMMVAEIALDGRKSHLPIHVIDVCAAPGGKSLHVAQILGERGIVEARDLTDAKIALINENIARCGATNVRAVKMDATVMDEASVGTADIVIADLPCSGLGVLRKKTDVKYKVSRERIAELAALQRRMLDVACAYVRDGGVLVYSTCTISPMENEENAAWFLENHADFSQEAQQQFFPEAGCGDGFFIAKFVKKT